MKNSLFKFFFTRFLIFFSFFLIFGNVSAIAQELTYNVLAVNGADETREKDIDVLLPPELTIDDILETDGLELEYDVNEAAYRVKGQVKLGPKQSKTYRVRVRDVWRIESKQIEDIKNQIEESISRIREDENQAVAEARKEELLARLDFIVQEQARNADNVQRRVDGFRAYGDEFKEIREKAVSVSYWKTKPPKSDDAPIITFTLEIENPTDSQLTVSPPHYLPSEVKPEHLENYEGFDLKYDAFKEAFYLEREETLEPKEVKRYQISVIDIWSIEEQDVENLRKRTNEAYKFLEESEYRDSAQYLISSIKENLESVEESQSIDRPIADHISAYRANLVNFHSATKDVEQLEDLLTALRENLERSKLKNVLEKVTQVQSLANIAESIFGTKPNKKDSWKVILGIIIFVGFITFIHFAIWGKRSKDKKLKDVASESEEKEEDLKEN